MLNLNRSQSVFTLLLLAASAGVVVAQSDKPERPTEADIQSVSADIDPSLRTTIAAKLKEEIDAAKERLADKQADVKQLQEKLRDEEQQLRQLDLKVQYLQDRLDQWTPKDEAVEAKSGDDETKGAKEEVKP